MSNMRYELCNLLKDFYNENDELKLCNSKEDYLPQAIEDFFSNAQVNARVRDYNVDFICAVESPGVNIYVLAVSWVNTNGVLDIYNEVIRMI